MVSVEDALLLCGWGRFHLTLLLLCGLAIVVEAINGMGLSLLLPSVACDLNLSTSDKGLISTLNSVGALIGSAFSGPFADHWGRRRVVLVLSFINAFTIFSCSFSQNKYFFVLCQFLVGMANGGVIPVIYVYYTEWQHKAKRGTMINVLSVSWKLGNIVCAALAWLVIPRSTFSFSIGDIMFHSWRIFVSLTSLPSLICAIGLIFMPDSPRFLLSKCKEEDAMDIILKIHSWNKQPSPLNIDCVRLGDSGISRSNPDNESGLNRFLYQCKEIKSLFRAPLLKRSIAMTVIMFFPMFAFFGIFMWFPDILNRLENSGNIDSGFCGFSATRNTTAVQDCKPPDGWVFKNILIASVATLPAYVITIGLVDRVGRKVLLMSSMLLHGVILVFMAMSDSFWQVLVLFILLFLDCVVSFSMGETLVTELYPTHIRSTATGVFKQAFRLGSLVGLILVSAAIDTNCELVLTLVGASVSAAAFVCLLLPNTTGTEIH